MRVLIADDDATSRLLLRTFATRLGHECLTADNGDQAWEQLQSDTVDVLLTDWMMPGLDGPELCRRQRDRDPATYTYIVLITSLGEREQVLAGMSAGADDYLVKPVDPFQLETRLVAAQRVTALHHQVREYRGRLERANLELLDQSRTDALTGVGNRRRMEEDLVAAVASAHRRRSTFSVLLLDIDHFKAYNDHSGHPAGDQALCRVARTIVGECRADDSAYRYGGEEFLVLLRDSGEQAAFLAAERIRRAVEELAVPHPASPTAGVVTVSLGVATWSPTAASIEALLGEADRTLYEAKAAGRNQTGAATVRCAG